MSEIQKNDTVLLGVSVDSVESHRKFREDNDFGFSLLADTDFEVSKQYSGIIEKFNASKRVTFIIDKAGYIRAIDKKVNVKTHGKDVVKSLKSVLPKIKVGVSAPEFFVNDAKGKTYQLSKFRDKKNVVLAFYPRDFGRG